MAKRQSDSTPIPLLLASDFFGFLLSLLPVTLTYFLTWKFFSEIASTAFFIPLLLVAPWVACLIFILIVGSVRMLFPQMKPGSYRVGLNAGFVSWSLNFYLNRAIEISGLRRFIFTNNILRFSYLRVMGTKVHFRMNGSMGIDLMDLPLLEIGEGSTLTEGVMVSAHSFTGQILVLSRTRIGENVFLGTGVTLGPGTDIGSRSWIGARNIFLADKIPPDSNIPNFVWDRGNPAKIEKAVVKLGGEEGKGSPA